MPTALKCVVRKIHRTLRKGNIAEKLFQKMMSIYHDQPATWQDLQTRVAKILSDLDFDTEIEKNVETVRGVVNIDVFAKKQKKSTREVLIVECKYWSHPVPKHVIHSFRTVVSDYGANTGYIISRNGFQSGAFEAAKYSNIHLMTFDEFQTELMSSWLEAVVDKVELLGYPLRKYADPMEDFYDNELSLLNSEKREQHRKLMHQYHVLSMATFQLNYRNAISRQLELDYLDSAITRYASLISKEVNINNLMDYFDYLKHISIKGVQEFDRLFGKSLRKN